MTYGMRQDSSLSRARRLAQDELRLQVVGSVTDIAFGRAPSPFLPRSWGSVFSTKDEPDHVLRRGSGPLTAVKLGDRATVRSKKSKPDRFIRSVIFVVIPEGFDGIKQMVARSFEDIAADVHG